MLRVFRSGCCMRTFVSKFLCVTRFPGPHGSTCGLVPSCNGDKLPERLFPTGPQVPTSSARAFVASRKQCYLLSWPKERRPRKRAAETYFLS